MKIGSLFSGIGGLELGLERAGVGHTVWQVEKDPFCRQVLEKHWPDAVRYEDVTSTDWSTVEPVEVLCGGFPCQPFSGVGQRRGITDERWGWPWFADSIRVVRPRFVVVENVPQLIRDADAFGWMLRDLHEFGFDAEWSAVSACSVGAPHGRDRLFLVAYPQGGGRRGKRNGIATPAQWRAGPEYREPEGSGAPTYWSSVPFTGSLGVAHGARTRLDGPRLRSHGNAVVPQVAEVVGRRLMELAWLV